MAILLTNGYCTVYTKNREAIIAAKWGVIEERTGAGEFVSYHVVPMVRPDPDGEAVMSWMHDLSEACQCHPGLMHGAGGWKIYDHHDPEHLGSKEREAI